MINPYRISSTIGRSFNVELEDACKTKKALKELGHFREPLHGMTPYPDRPLFSGIESFQASHGLKKDGLIKPGGPTELKIGEALSEKITQTKPVKKKVAVSVLKPDPKPTTFGLHQAVGAGKPNLPRDVQETRKALSWAGFPPTTPVGQQGPGLNEQLLNFQRAMN